MNHACRYNSDLDSSSEESDGEITEEFIDIPNMKYIELFTGKYNRTFDDEKPQELDLIDRPEACAATPYTYRRDARPGSPDGVFSLDVTRLVHDVCSGPYFN